MTFQLPALITSQVLTVLVMYLVIAITMWFFWRKKKSTFERLFIRHISVTVGKWQRNTFLFTTVRAEFYCRRIATLHTSQQHHLFSHRLLFCNLLIYHCTVHLLQQWLLFTAGKKHVTDILGSKQNLFSAFTLLHWM